MAGTPQINLIKQPEKLYALLAATLFCTGAIFGFELSIVGSLIAVGVSAAMGYALVPVFRFMIDFAQKIKILVDHVDDVAVKAKSELDELKALKESLTQTVQEANETLSEFKKTTLVQGNSAIVQTTQTIKELQSLVDNIAQNTLPEVNKSIATVQGETLPRIDRAIATVQGETLPAVNAVIDDVHNTMGYVNNGAQTASTLLRPVTTTAALLRTVGNAVGLGGTTPVKEQQKKSDAQAAENDTSSQSIKKSKQKAGPRCTPASATRQVTNKPKGRAITPAYSKAKKAPPAPKTKVAKAQEHTQDAQPQASSAAGYLSYLKFW